MAPYDEQKLPLYHESPLISLRTISSDTLPLLRSSRLSESSLTKRNRRNEDGGGETVINYNSTSGIRKIRVDPWSSSKEATHRIRDMVQTSESRREKSKKIIESKILLSFMQMIVVLGVCCFIANIAFTVNSLEVKKKDGDFPDLPRNIKFELQKLREKKKQEEEQRRRQEKQQHISKSQIIAEEAFRKSNDAKQPVMSLLKQAGIDTNLDKETYDKLPTWKQITDLYGTKPRFHGLETCERFRSTGDPAEHFLGTAGTFNTGTNLMSELLIANCHMQPRMDKYGEVNKGVRWQVPWGKHSPPGDEEFRLHHKTAKDKTVGNNILPAVTIRDPYSWLRSMCRHKYTAKWSSSFDGHCPNLVPSKQDKTVDSSLLKDTDSVKVNVKYSDFIRDHDSLVHMWNDWYEEYIDTVTIPRVLVRYEDLLFFPKETVTTVCECAGGSMKKNGEFKYIVSSAKKGEAAHGKMSERTGYIDAIVKYGTDEHRYDGFHEEDLQYVRDNINDEYMSIFGYHH